MSIETLPQPPLPEVPRDEHGFVTIAEKFNELSPELLDAAATAMIEQADELQLEITGGVKADGTMVEPAPNPNVVLRKIQRCLGWELDEPGSELMLMGDVHPLPDIKAAGQKAQARVATYWKNLFGEDETGRGERLYNTFKQFNASVDPKTMDSEERRELAHYMLLFKQAGWELSEADRAQLQEMQKELQASCQAFSDNRANLPTLSLTPDQLQGAPQSFIDSLDASVVPGKQDVRLLQPNTNNYKKVMAWVPDRLTRKEVWDAYYQVGMPTNKDVLTQMATLRLQIAQKLGYKSWAHMQVQESMAGTPEGVARFFAELQPGIQGKVKAELSTMQLKLNADIQRVGNQGLPTEMQGYDTGYYTTQLQQECGLNEAAISEHLNIDSMLEGVFDVVGEIFNLRFEAVKDAPTWAEDVQLIRIYDTATGLLKSECYLDLFDRPGTNKESNPATYTLQDGHLVDPANSDPKKHYQLPKSAVTMCLKRGTFSIYDLAALTHEFGHVANIAVSRTESVEYGGNHTERDFSEAPSQMTEKLPTDAVILGRLSGGTIPADILNDFAARQDAVLKAANGLDLMRMLKFSLFDAAMHGAFESTEDININAIIQTVGSLTEVPDIAFWPEPAWFNHLANPGYAGRYYGYLWSLVYAYEMLDKVMASDPGERTLNRVRLREALSHGGAWSGKHTLEHIRAGTGVAAFVGRMALVP